MKIENLIRISFDQLSFRSIYGLARPICQRFGKGTKVNNLPFSVFCHNALDAHNFR